MLANIAEFREAAAESLRLDWRVVCANLIGIFFVFCAGTYARITDPLVQETVQAGLF